jgi:hypothetical protein
MKRTKKTMDPQLRKVLQVSMETLWASDGQDLPATRGRALNVEAVKELLRQGVYKIVVLGVHWDLTWIEGDEIFIRWKEELRDHLEDEARLYLEDYPGGYYHRASEWTLTSGETIILFEMYH